MKQLSQEFPIYAGPIHLAKIFFRNFMLSTFSVIFMACGESHYFADILVKDPDGRTVVGALVVYDGPSKNEKLSSRTNAAGIATIGYLSRPPVGDTGKRTTHITISKEGYESISLPCVLMRRNESILEVKLAKLAAKN